MADVRPATEDDLRAINDIYNGYVVETPITFDIDPIAMDVRREWFGHYDTSGRHRLFVAAEGPHVVGYATSSALFDRRAYETSVMASIYLSMDHRGRGVGSALYRALFDALAFEDVHRAYAGITMPNDASVALHEKFGFHRVAYFTEQGRKFGKYWDVAWYEKEMT